MDSALKTALNKRGLQMKDLIGKEGLCYVQANRHYNGKRPVSAEYALKYEKLLGIPRYELRPDLWTPAMFLYLRQDDSQNVAPASKS